VKLPGSNTFVPLDQHQDLPRGTIVDVSGLAAIELSDPSGNQMFFYGVNDGVPSLFSFQGTVGGFVQLWLTGGNLKFSLAPAAKVKKPARRLWGNGKGKFATKGRYASAIVRGTNWLIADYPDHTLVTVKRGLVAVRNLVTKQTKLVSEGHSIIVRGKPKTTKK
jgi:hypothetical protein